MVLSPTLLEHSNGVEIDNTSHEVDFLLWEQEFQKPGIHLAEELPYEAEILDQSRSMLASAALGSMIEVRDVAVKEQYQNLMVAAKRALIDQKAREMIKMNAKTDYLERAYKSGHVTKVRLETESGVLSQHGQSMMSVNANSLQYLNNDLLRSRARIETHNAVRQQKYFEAGLLKDYTMVTFSLVPQEISPQEAKQLGFFSDTMSLAIQAIGNANDQGVELESAFVAGADSHDDRFDIDVVIELLAEMGIDMNGKNTEQLLASPILVHNRFIENGVIDIVAMYDRIATKKTGVDRFYGRKGRQDYHTHKAECVRRELRADEVAERTTNRIIALSSNFNTPTDATRKLHELNDAEIKQRIITDKSIDANVLGGAVVKAVEQAREYYAMNDMTRYQQAMIIVISKGRSSSCPTELGVGESTVVGVETLSVEDSDSPESKSSGKTEMTCPFCDEKTVADPCADCITCTNCTASTKHSAEENRRRAAQYRRIKEAQIASNTEIKKRFKAMTSERPSNDQR